jgi:hypothetical protein
MMLYLAAGCNASMFSSSYNNAQVILNFKHICAKSGLLHYGTNINAISKIERHRLKVQSSPVLHLIQMLPWLNVVSPTPHHVIHTSND